MCTHVDPYKFSTVHPPRLKCNQDSASHITLFRAITMFCRIDTILQNIHHIQYECEEYYVGLTLFYKILLTFSLNAVNIMLNIVSPVEHCYGSE
jgi:hypothetical protein